MNFWMELEPIDLFIRIFDGGIFRIFSARDAAKASGKFCDFVTVRIPYLEAFRKTCKQRAGTL